MIFRIKDSLWYRATHININVSTGLPSLGGKRTRRFLCTDPDNSKGLSRGHVPGSKGTEPTSVTSREASPVSS